MADIINLESHYIGSPTPGVNLYQLPNASMQVIEDVINATWNEGLTTKQEFSAKIAAALTDFLNTVTTPRISPVDAALPSVTAPDVVIPQTQASDVTDAFQTEYIELVAMLSDKFVAFRTAYFPDEQAAYSAAEDWLQAAINNPDAGLPPAIAEQIWTDDRDRIVRDGNRASAEVLAAFASKGFALPPGAAASAILQIEQQTQDKISESSRKVAAMSVDVQKFNIESLLKLRQIAIGTATDYIKALASGPDTASRVVGIGYDAQSKLISAAADFYRADVSAADIKTKASQYNASSSTNAQEKNQAADLTIIEDKLRALLAEAQSIAQISTALFNNLNVQASIRGDGGTTVSQAGGL